MIFYGSFENLNFPENNFLFWVSYRVDPCRRASAHGTNGEGSWSANDDEHEKQSHEHEIRVLRYLRRYSPYLKPQQQKGRPLAAPQKRCRGLRPRHLFCGFLCWGCEYSKYRSSQHSTCLTSQSAWRTVGRPCCRSDIWWVRRTRERLVVLVPKPTALSRMQQNTPGPAERKCRQKSGFFFSV